MRKKREGAPDLEQPLKSLQEKDLELEPTGSHPACLDTHMLMSVHKCALQHPCICVVCMHVCVLWNCVLVRMHT